MEFKTWMKRPGEFFEVGPDAGKITILSAKNDRVTLMASHGTGQQQEKRRETCRTIWGEFPVGE